MSLPSAVRCAMSVGPSSPARVTLACVSLFGWLIVGGCAQEPGCRDRDGDRYGPGCEDGPDCDDDDPGRHDRCDLPGPDCDAEPEAEGCPCVGFRKDCRLGPPETDGVGQCRPGVRYCLRQAWSACEDAVGPERERCNGLDDDCDGRTDERVRSPCGGCNDSCTGEVWGEASVPFTGEAPLALTDSGMLTLERTPREALGVWVANTEGRSVSRIDAREATEVARYALDHHPTHLAVDFFGDAWVVGQGGDDDSAALYRIASDAQRCTDTGAGVRTSTGPEDVLPVGEDSCVVLQTPLPEGPVRSLAIDGTRDADGLSAGLPWLGYAERVEQRDATGAVRRMLDAPDVVPYTATFDPWGHLWLVDRAGVLARVDPVEPDGAVERFEPPLACYELDSIASDPAGRLLLSSFACESLIRFDPSQDRFREAQSPSVLSTRGVVILGEDAWVAHTAGQLSRATLAPLAFAGTHNLAQADARPADTSALSADSDGQLWAISRIGGPDGRGLATRFDPETRRVSAQVPVGRGPRALGDFTGMAQAASFAPEGSERHTFIGCAVEQQVDGGRRPAGTLWQRLHVSYQAGEGASIVVRLRHAARRAELSEATWEERFVLPEETPPFELSLPEGGVVQVELQLRASHHIGAPRVLRVGLEWRCPGPS